MLMGGVSFVFCVLCFFLLFFCSILYRSISMVNDSMVNGQWSSSDFRFQTSSGGCFTLPMLYPYLTVFLCRFVPVCVCVFVLCSFPDT
ncbi:hypothetical protein BZA05DRAFT_396506 [Tricharina praecox]|uniref:uncharacterized protein n=1 Tax=Tricharina praecox TaxID=43433 RepID=UPI00221FC5DD|nr:uncharacterized protein BZA05DRAFT_396506 [Tricharina praecox]KAI5853559.1 hypothetical protein BZA05DRAFT_396506 [Tricharina praecox]